MPASVSPLRGVARLLIPALVRGGLGSNAIISVLQPLGLTYRRTIMLADIREFSGLAKLEGAVLRVAAEQMFPPYAMVQTALRRARTYRVYGRVTVEDVETGESSERTVSFYTDKLDSKQGWERSFLEESEGSESRGAQRYAAVSIVSVEHQTGWRY